MTSIFDRFPKSCPTGPQGGQGLQKDTKMEPRVTKMDPKGTKITPQDTQNKGFVVQKT